MENHEENIQQEILDSMAKKVTELEKRQGKIDALELASVPEKLKELHSTINEVKEMKIAEFGNQLMAYEKQLTSITNKINAIPTEIPVKNRIEFDAKSKFVIKIIVGLTIAVAVLIGITVSLLFENNRSTDETYKYLILRGFYPEVARYIDTAYANNKDFLIKEAEANIDEQQTMSEAAFAAKQAAEESRLANEKLRKLKNTNPQLKKRPDKK
jgi:septal ring factor EnvC (AmiA/AmiB activator)